MTARRSPVEGTALVISGGGGGFGSSSSFDLLGGPCVQRRLRPRCSQSGLDDFPTSGHFFLLALFFADFFFAGLRAFPWRLPGGLLRHLPGGFPYDLFLRRRFLRRLGFCFGFGLGLGLGFGLWLCAALGLAVACRLRQPRATPRRIE